MSEQNAVEQQEPEVYVPEFEQPVQEAEAAATAPADLFSEMLPNTPELVVPPPEPEVTRGEITGVSREDAATGSVGIRVSLKSTDTAVEDSLTYWPPIEFVEDISVDPSTLSNEPKPGKKQSPRERYGVVVRNSTKTADIQKLLALAAEQDRHITGAPNDFDEFVALLDELLTGIPVVFTRRPEKNAEPQYANRLKVGVIEPASAAENPKKFKRMIKRWEQ